MDIVKSWKDPEYRADQTTGAPHPAGSPNLSRLAFSEVTAAAGGTNNLSILYCMTLGGLDFPCAGPTHPVSTRIC